MSFLKFTLITSDDVINILKPIEFDKNIIVDNIKTFQSAFIHESVCQYLKTIQDTDVPSNLKDLYGLQSYERLEFLGDSFMQWHAGLFVFMKYPDKDPGFLTTSRINMVNKRALNIFATKLGLKKFLCLIPDEKHPHVSEKIYSDIFESFLGSLVSVFGNSNEPGNFLLNVFSRFVTQELLEDDCNYKSQLLKYYHQQKWGHPQYKLVSQTKDTESGNIEFISAVLDHTHINI